MGSQWNLVILMMKNKWFSASKQKDLRTFTNLFNTWMPWISLMDHWVYRKQPFSRHNWRLAYVINVIIAMTSNKPEEIIENRLLFKNKVWKCIVYVFVAKIINWFQPNNFHKITWVKLCTKGNFLYKKIEPIYFCTLVLSMSLH